MARAIVQSVQNGVNVLDTAINYRRERGEKSVGQALERLIGSGEIHRDEILVCTKGGFLPQSLGAQWYAKQFGKGGGGIGMDDLVAGCHCMHPEYLSNQLVGFNHSHSLIAYANIRRTPKIVTGRLNKGGIFQQ